MNLMRKVPLEGIDSFLYRKDSRKLYMENDIDITEDIELEPGTAILLKF